MPKLVAISDTHSSHGEFTTPECDILVHAGDFTCTGAFNQIKDFLYWFRKQPAKHKILIAGNHEQALDHTHQEFNPHCRKLVENQKDFIYLEDSWIEIDGLKIYGTPWTPEFCGWGFNGVTNANEGFENGRLLRDVYDQIPRDTNIIICHGPVYDICDKAGFADERTGSVEMRKITCEMPDLRLYLCGHIHEARGMEYADGGVCYANVSTLARDYVTIRPPVVFHLDENGHIDSIEGYEE